MASRLSSDLSGRSTEPGNPSALASLAASDHGLASFAWQTSNLPTPIEEERNARAFLDSILASSNPAVEISNIEPSFIRHVVLTAGVEDYLEVLPLLTRDQMTHIMDFEGWDTTGQVSLAGTARWLQLHKQAKPEELFSRFHDLEEEFQMAVLGPVVETFDLEAFEEMSQEEQDSLSRLPCGEVFYKIKATDPELRQFVEELVTQALATNIEYAYSMLAHASYLPPNEQEALALRFRNARLEEEGFVSPEDSARLFLTGAGEEAIKRWTGVSVADFVDRILATVETARLEDENPGETALAVAGTSTGPRQDGMTIEKTLAACDPDCSADIAAGLSRLANTVAVAAGVEGDNPQGLRLVLAHTKGYCNLGLELLSSSLAGDSGENVDMEKSMRIVTTEHPSVLFKATIAVMDELRRRTVDSLEKPGNKSGILDAETAQQIRRLIFARRFGLIMNLLDFKVLPVAGFEATEVLKGMFNRFPLCPGTTPAGSAGERMTFKPVYDMATLMEMLRWVRQLRDLAPAIH
jgi:hypothetical protein